MQIWDRGDMSPLLKRGHFTALQILSRKRDGLVPKVERYGDRSAVIYKRKSLIDWAVQLSFPVGTIVALCVVDSKILNPSIICHAS